MSDGAAYPASRSCNQRNAILEFHTENEDRRKRERRQAAGPKIWVRVGVIVLANDCTSGQVQYLCFATNLNSSVQGPMVRVLREPQSSPSRQSGFFRAQPLKPTEG